MAIPTQTENLHGTLVFASSGSTGNVGPAGTNELGLPIGLSIANTGVVQSANITCPSMPSTCYFLVQLASGSATLIADRSTDGTTPTFASANKVQVLVNHGEPVFVGPLQMANGTVTNTNGVLTVTAVTNVVALQITNTSGVALTVSQMGLIHAVQKGKLNESHNSNTDAIEMSGSTLDTSVQDGTGKFTLST